jgi:CRP-like cAMP-binding protein
MALVDSSPRSASVRAQTRVVALELGRDVFERLVKSANPFALRFQRQIALAGIRQLRLANARLTGLLGRGEKLEEPTESAEPRITRVQTALYEWDVSVEE